MRRGSRRACPFSARNSRHGTQVALDLHVNCVPTPARRREAGVTLIEALVVLAILGLVTAVITVPINSYWQRSRLQSAAGDVRNFLQVAYTEAVNQHTQVTVSMQQVAGKWQLQIAPAPLRGPSTFLFPDVVDCTTLNPAATAGGWPAIGPVRSLVCAPNGLTFIPAGATCAATESAGSQVREVKTLSITHTSMVDGSLSPNTRFDIQIFPIWNVSYQKVLL